MEVTKKEVKEAEDYFINLGDEIITFFNDGNEKLQTILSGTPSESPLEIVSPKLGEAYISYNLEKPKADEKAQLKAAEQQAKEGLDDFQGAKAYSHNKKNNFWYQNYSAKQLNKAIDPPPFKEPDAPKGYGSLTDEELIITGTVKPITSWLTTLGINDEIEVSRISIELQDTAGNSLELEKKSTTPATTATAKKEKSTAIFEMDAQVKGEDWSVDIGQLAKPYFGLVKIIAKPFMKDPQGQEIPMAFEEIKKDFFYVKRDFVIFGVQLGFSDGLRELTNDVKNLVCTYSSHEPEKDEATAKERAVVRLMHRFEGSRKEITRYKTDYLNAAIFDQDAEGKKVWQQETVTAPTMPDIHVELQILGFTKRARTAYHAYLVIEKTPEETIKKLFTVKCDWSTSLKWRGGPIRTKKKGSSDSFKNSQFIKSDGWTFDIPGKGQNATAYENDIQKDIFKGNTELVLYDLDLAASLQHYKHLPFIAPDTIHSEPTVPTTVAETKRHWMGFVVDDTSGFPTAVIPWQVSIGQWQTKKDETVDMATMESANDSSDYVFKPRVRGGDLAIEAEITVFNEGVKKAFLPTARIELNANPSEAIFKQMLSQTSVLDNMLTLASNKEDLSSTDLKNINAFLDVYGRKEWLKVAANMLGHESHYQQYYNLDNSGDPRKRSVYTWYRTHWYFKESQMPIFGAPAGWGIGQFDNPAPASHETFWDWTKIMDEFLYRFTVIKLKFAFNSVFDLVKGPDNIGVTQYYNAQLKIATDRVHNAIKKSTKDNILIETIQFMETSLEFELAAEGLTEEKIASIRAKAISSYYSLSDYQKIKTECKFKFKDDDTQSLHEAGYMGEDNYEQLILNYVEKYHDRVGDTSAAPKGETSDAFGNSEIWYSNTIRDGKGAFDALKDDNSSDKKKKNAANVIAWLAVRDYNGSNSKSVLYPYSVHKTKLKI